MQFDGADYSNRKYFVPNYQGSIIGMTDTAGNLLETYKYTAYGEPKNLANNEYWGGSRFRYTGQIALPEAKLYYYKARVYDPKLGTFLQTDPIGTKDDMDLYSYVGDDPVNKTDPSGLDAVILNDTFAKAGKVILDHQAIMIGNNEKGWTYISKDHAQGELSRMTFGAIGKSSYTIAHFKNINEAFKSPTLARYERAVQIDSTNKEDNRMVAAATKKVKEDYNVVANNCGDVVESAMRAGGMQSNIGSHINPADAKINSSFGRETKTILDKRPGSTN